MKIKIFKFRIPKGSGGFSEAEEKMNEFLRDKELIELKVDVANINYHRNLGHSPEAHLIYTVIYRYSHD